MERGRGWRRGKLPVLALHAAGTYCRLDRKPPVTAALVAANALVYVRPEFLDSILPPIHEVWFNPHLILQMALIGAALVYLISMLALLEFVLQRTF